MACDDCPEELREEFGCGYNGFEGKATVKYEHGADVEPYCKTCPRYYAQDPAIIEILSDLKDYKRGAFGNVLDLPAGYLEYLRIAENEQEKWEATQQSQIFAEQQAEIDHQTL